MTSPVVSRDPARPRTLREILAAHERLVIVQVLASCGGSRTQAAASLGISRGRLYAKIRKLAIDLGTMPPRTGRPRSLQLTR